MTIRIVSILLPIVFFSFGAFAQEGIGVAAEQQAKIANAVQTSQVCPGLQNQVIASAIIYGGPAGGVTDFEHMQNNAPKENGSIQCVRGIDSIVTANEDKTDPTLYKKLKAGIQSAMTWLAAKVQKNENLRIDGPPVTIGIRG